MSLDGMSIESDSLAIHEHPAEDQHEEHPQSPDMRKSNNQQQQQQQQQQQSYDADSSRPSVIETANKAPQVIECT